MKSLLITSLLFFSFAGHASDFINSKYLYQLKKNHEKMVNNSGDVWIRLDSKNHEGFIDMEKVAEDYFGGWEGLNSWKMKNLGKKKRMEKLVSDTRFEGAYFCHTFLEDAGLYNETNAKDCISSFKKLLSNAVEKADAVYTVEFKGNYYGSYGGVVILLVDFQTKETIALDLPYYHEI